MSKFTTVYNTLIALPGILFTGADAKTEIPNPYSLEDNPQQFLYKSWGLRVDSAERLQSRSDNCHMAVAHSFTYVLTYEVLRLDTDVTEFHDKVKLLKEDAQKLSMRLHREDELSLGSDLTIIEVGSVSEIIFVLAGKTKLISIEVPFTITIRELIQ